MPRGVHVELTVVMPCLNEAETVATCVRKAVKFIADRLESFTFPELTFHKTVASASFPSGEPSAWLAFACRRAR